MFVPGREIFRLSEETQATVRASSVEELMSPAGGSRGFGAPKLTHERILEAAHRTRARIREQWADFSGQPPLIAKKVCYDVMHDCWVREPVMIQLDERPFGCGAMRECFRMKEVKMEDDSQEEAHPIGAGKFGQGGVDGGGKAPLSFFALARGLMELQHHERRTIWVAKRSMSDFKRKILHRRACEADAVYQTMAKHYAEMFNQEVHRRADESGLGRCGAHDIDFLLTHVVELPDGFTYGAESYVLGHYQKHNTNGGYTIGIRKTPQAFSYFTFIRSNRRLMIVDIQGVGDLYTDPVIHFLPSHFTGSLAKVDGEMNSGLRGFSLFLWSHRPNDVDRLLDLPTFLLAPHEEAHFAPAGSTVSELHTMATQTKSREAIERREGDGFTVHLDEVPGVRLADWCDWRTRLPMEAASSHAAGGDGTGRSRWNSSDLELVEAECHMEIAVMYNQGRITLRADEPRGDPDKKEVEAAVFHLAEAARQDLPDALLALARLASGREHTEFLPQVVSTTEHMETSMALLAHAASLGSAVAMGALARLVLDAEPCSKVPSELRCVALHLEAFAAAEVHDTEVKLAKAREKLAEVEQRALEREASNEEEEEDEDEDEDEDELDYEENEHHSMFRQTFGWEDHGWNAPAALLRAAELWEGASGEAEGEAQGLEDGEADGAASEAAERA
eukprot:CAMPEP_0176035066 /NCGR_PEP_ID=MMETSP0120_2-20121206/17339_1 /TAXON_ID=160619 /ORGANISM="Kryptoperidinium foliaceum, Strain CCMP 1326" /LENGTH=675 /DNA_ID=CAMNT_0017368411 /DNA_START=42 /DNA_END=2066 /DNA_ORIENTATION=-